MAGRGGNDGRRLDDGAAKCACCEGQGVLGIVGTVSPDIMATWRESMICSKEGLCHVESDWLMRDENPASLSRSHNL